MGNGGVGPRGLEDDQASRMKGHDSGTCQEGSTQEEVRARVPERARARREQWESGASPRARAATETPRGTARRAGGAPRSCLAGREDSTLLL